MDQVLASTTYKRFYDNEVEANKLFSKVAKEKINSNRLAYARASAARLWRFWLSEYPTYFFPKSGSEYLARGQYLAIALKIALHLLNLALVLGLLWSFWVLRRQVAFWPYILVVIYFNVSHAMLVTTARYSVPFVGLAIVLILSACSRVLPGGGGGSPEAAPSCPGK
jgi:hypothetical protein